MPTKKRSSSQVKSDRRAMRILRDAGLLSKKTNLAKTPSRYTKSLLRKYADVVEGKAKVVRPKKPSSYKNIFRVKGDKVVVPRRKGEKINVDPKSGEIVGSRKVGGRIVRSRFKSMRTPKDVDAIEGERRRGARKTPKQYAIPFNRGGGDVEWKRFPDWTSLRDFMRGYETYKRWPDYVVEEEIGEDLDADELNERLGSKLDRIRRGPSRKRPARARGLKKANAGSGNRRRSRNKRTR